MNSSICVQVQGSGHQVFDLLKDPRIRLFDGTSPPDIVVCPCAGGMETKLDELIARSGAAERLREGQAVLAIDASGEGRSHDARFSTGLHSSLNRAAVGAGQVRYLTQNRLYEQDYAAWARCAGIGDPVEVKVYDYFVRNFFTLFETDSEAKLWRKEKRFRRRQARRAKRYISLNRTLRPTKLVFLSRLVRDGLWDLGYVSCGGLSKSMPGRKVETRLRDLGSFADLADEVVESLDAILARHCSELLFDRASRVLDSFAEPHDDSFFTVVTETEMEDRPVRITEKPMKALTNYHPFLVLGNPGSLELLRGMGFRTFAGWLDESYDAESDPRVRFELVYSEFQRLCAMTDQQLVRQERELTDVLRHNARRAVVELPALYLEKLDAELVDWLVCETPAEGRQARTYQSSKRLSSGHWR